MTAKICAGKGRLQSTDHGVLSISSVVAFTLRRRGRETEQKTTNSIRDIYVQWSPSREWLANYERELIHYYRSQFSLAFSRSQRCPSLNQKKRARIEMAGRWFFLLKGYTWLFDLFLVFLVAEPANFCSNQGKVKICSCISNSLARK